MLDIDSPSNLPDIENTEWDYDQSVKRMCQLVVKWKNLSLEVLKELYTARMNLSNRGGRWSNEIGWGNYLNDVGITRTTAHRWLGKYDFDRHELITDETIRLPQEIEIDDVLPTTHTCPSCGYGYDDTSVDTQQIHRLDDVEMVEHQRHPEDFYPTPPVITKMLLDREELTGNIWEPACGKGHMSEVLISRGYDVLSTDLIDRGYGEGGIDFLDDAKISKFGSVDNIITNPPFRFSLDFVLQSKKIARNKICMLNTTMFLDGIKRYEMWVDKDFPLKAMYQFAGRVPFRKNEIVNQNECDLIRFPRAWFVFEKGYTGKPTIDWILPELNAKT